MEENNNTDVSLGNSDERKGNYKTNDDEHETQGGQMMRRENEEVKR